MYQLSETSKRIEQDLEIQHEQEMKMLEEEIAAMGPPTEKFSKKLLNMKVRLTKLIQSKKYAEAKILREDVQDMEEKELMLLEVNHDKAINKLRENKKKKQQSEYESVKARLEKNINSKLKQRMEEYEKLLLRIQNVHNDMAAKQTKEFNKIQSIHAKLLAKYSLDLNSIRLRQEAMREERSVMNNKSEQSSIRNEFEPSIKDSQNGEYNKIKSEKYSYDKDAESIEVENVIEDEKIVMSNNSSSQKMSNQEIEEIPVETIEETNKNNSSTPKQGIDSELRQIPQRIKDKKENKRLSYESDDLVEPEDNVKGFNNFYRVQTKHFPAESSEDEDDDDDK